MGERKSENTDKEQDVKDIGLDWLDMGDVTLLHGSRRMGPALMGFL